MNSTSKTEQTKLSPADQILAAIAAGFAAGAEDEWEAPEFETARDLTEKFGCSWDFIGWRATASTIRNHQMLGGVPLASAIRDAVETDEVLRPYRAGEKKMTTATLGGCAMTTSTTTLRSAIAAQMEDRAVETETFSHRRHYHKLHVYRDGRYAWHEFLNASDDLIDDRAEHFQAIPSLVTVGCGSQLCSCEYCDDTGYETVEDAVADAVAAADLQGLEEMLLEQLDRIPVGYFDDEEETR